MLEKLFKLKRNNTTVKTEVIAGITSFMTMAYILAVNPQILSASGMDPDAVLAATAIAAFIGTFLMAAFANYPFALAPGMGLNVYFTYSVCIGYGLDWRVALAAVFVEGIIFILLSAAGIREKIFNAIPTSLKFAVSAGIGLFIAFIGLQNAKLIVANPTTLVSAQTFKENFNSAGIGGVLSVAGLILLAILLVKKVKGAVLIAILSTWCMGMICQAFGVYVPNPDIGMYSLYPEFGVWFSPGALGKTFGQVFKADFTGVSIMNFISVIFAFLFVDMFGTIGTLVGVSSKADMLDKEGRLPRIKGVLVADSIAMTTSAVLGTSTTTTYVESAAGVSEGGRTGLTAVITAFLFLASLFLTPIFKVIPGFATAPALIAVGFFMIADVAKINFEDRTESIPAFLCIIVIPLAYSISEGISIGILSYVFINVVTGKAKEKKIGLLMYILAALFICKYIFL